MEHTYLLGKQLRHTNDLFVQSYHLNTPNIRKENIAILSIVDSQSSREMYKTAMDSMECYALQNNYTYLRLIGADFKDICEQNHINFQRHCIIAHILKSSNFTWVLHVDGDVGVVNEKRRLEEFIKEDFDIIFYERFFNSEPHISPKNRTSIIFLRGWADYAFRVPEYFHGDNAALHMWLVELFAPNTQLTPTCLILWHGVLWKTVVKFKYTWPYYTLCCREVLKNATLSRVFIYIKGEGWVRDSWLTNSQWSIQRDFMFHNRKQKWKKHFNLTQARVLQGPRFDWFDTLRSPLDLRKCRSGEETWNHETALIVDKQDLDLHLERRREGVEKLHQVHLQFLHKFASRLMRTWTDEDLQATE